MSWNIERLGDAGPLGRHKGRRPDAVIKCIAQIIHAADVHICAVIEVFDPQGSGGKEMARIHAELKSLGAAHQWELRLSDGGTGGLSDPDGSNRQACEGYAVLYRSADGIVCEGVKWLKIHGDQERYAETTRGRSYLRDACEFAMKIEGAGKLFDCTGRDLRFPVAVFHAPGPRADPQRQAQIKGAISALFKKYPRGATSSPGVTHPNVFICADFNASEDADNLLGHKVDHEVDFSFRGDLERLASLSRLVMKSCLLTNWVAGNRDLVGIDWAEKDVRFAADNLGSDRCKEVAGGAGGIFFQLVEQSLDRAEYWFVHHPRQAKLSGIAHAQESANDFLVPIVTELIKDLTTEEKFNEEKLRFNKWKKALKARTRERTSKPVYRPSRWQ